MLTASACAGTGFLVPPGNADVVVIGYVSCPEGNSSCHSPSTTLGNADMRRRAAPIGMSVREVSYVLRSAHLTGSWSVIPVASYPHDGI